MCIQLTSFSLLNWRLTHVNKFTQSGRIKEASKKCNVRIFTLMSYEINSNCSSIYVKLFAIYQLVCKEHQWSLNGSARGKKKT